MAFRDRTEAGRRLAERLRSLPAPPPVVEAMPRGGVPVGYEIARALGAPLDVLLVRKLGYPMQPELGLGAIGEAGVRIVNEQLVKDLGVPRAVLEEIARREGAELERRLRAYRGDRPPVPVAGRCAVVVDDGLATGFTARAGIEVLRRRGAGRVLLAVPVAPLETVEELSSVADAVVCLEQPLGFTGIGQWYGDFRQVSDAEVSRYLAAASPAGPGQGSVRR